MYPDSTFSNDNINIDLNTFSNTDCHIPSSVLQGVQLTINWICTIMCSWHTIERHRSKSLESWQEQGVNFFTKRESENYTKVKQTARRQKQSC